MSALFANVEDRTVKGLLLPYGEASRLSVSGAEPVSFAKGTVKLPRDPKALNANIGHDRFMPAARFESIEDTDAGLVAEFSVANTEEGDDLLAGIASGRLTRLSAEVRDLVRNGAFAVSAVLTGAAFVSEGAFASAALFEVAQTEEHQSEEFTDEHGVTWKRVQDTIRTVDEDGTTTTETTVVESVEAPDSTPEEDNTREEFAMTNSIVPDGVGTPEAANKVDHSASALFADLASAHTNGDTSKLGDYEKAQGGNLFALKDITAGNRAADSGAGITATTGISGTISTAQFIGEVYAKKAYTQRVLPLFRHENLTSLKVSGWKWETAPAVGDWAGNKTDIPSNEVSVSPVETIAERIAGGHDIDRALRDFGNEEWWASYFRTMAESYAKQADNKIYAKVIAGATTVAPGTVPSGVDAGTAALVDGALSVVNSGLTPTFALVSSAIYRTLLLTPKDKVLEFLSAGVGLEEGDLAGFKIVPHASLTAKRVIVGSREAGTVYELPGSPVRVEGLDVAKGGIDPALYGYIAFLINDASGIASVTTA